MKKLYTIAMIGAVCIFAAFAPEIASNGAPASSTGAPNEATCGMVNCHDDGTANSGTAVHSLTYGSGINEYIPGETYPITVRIEDVGVVRFGYQLLALRNSDGANAGTFEITDSYRTQIIDNYFDTLLADRRYATYLYPGTDPVSPGVGEWTINWKAPNTDQGPITFYFATISANDDDSDSGDKFYTGSTEIVAAAASTSKEAPVFEKVSVYPNPTSDILNIRLVETSKANITLYNDLGSVVRTSSVADRNQISFDVSNLPKGNYILKINQNKNVIAKKVIL